MAYTSCVFRLSDEIESYIKSQLTNGTIFQCNKSYAVWSDGVKTAKVIYNDVWKKTELERTLEIAQELSKTTIPHTKVLDYKIFEGVGSVLIMDYVGEDLEVSGLENDPEISKKLDELIKLIESYGYNPDCAECNFCYKNGTLTAIDYPDWKRERY